jgi:DNA-binding NarL/FixJ family response regulator
MNELLRGIERAFDRQTYLSPGSESLFARPARIAPRISPRERQIALLYLSENDWTVDDVAGMLRISSQTVRSHLARLRSHFTAAGFSVRNRLELRQALVEIGMLDSAEAGQPMAVTSAPPDLPGASRFRYADSSVYSSKVG